MSAHQRKVTELPTGWERRTSEEGHKYYVDGNTMTSHWEVPGAGNAAAAAADSTTNSKKRNSSKKKSSASSTKEKEYAFPKTPARRHTTKNTTEEDDTAVKSKKRRNTTYKYAYIGCDQWYYKDESGVVQGPFQADNMYDWMEDGYISSSLSARIGNAGPFRRVDMMYSDLMRAFTCLPTVEQHEDYNEVSHAAEAAVTVKTQQGDPKARAPAFVDRAPQVLHTLKDLRKQRPSSTTGMGQQYDNEGLTFLASVDFVNVPLSSAGEVGKVALDNFFQLIDIDGGGSLSLAEFTKAFRTIGNRLGGSFTHPGAFKLYTRIDIHRSQALTKDAFVDAVMQFQPDDMDLLRILLAVDRVTNGGLGGLFKEWRGVDFVHWRDAERGGEKGTARRVSVGGKKKKLNSLVKKRNSNIGTHKFS